VTDQDREVFRVAATSGDYTGPAENARLRRALALFGPGRLRYFGCPRLAPVITAPSKVAGLSPVAPARASLEAPAFPLCERPRSEIIG
jgi:hypothetical protein